jgi:hypothetical protein
MYVYNRMYVWIPPVPTLLSSIPCFVALGGGVHEVGALVRSPPPPCSGAGFAEAGKNPTVRSERLEILSKKIGELM